jgi:hypothetical protein
MKLGLGEEGPTKFCIELKPLCYRGFNLNIPFIINVKPERQEITVLIPYLLTQLNNGVSLHLIMRIKLYYNIL